MRSYTLKLFWWFWLTAAVAVVASHMIGKLAEEEQYASDDWAQGEWVVDAASGEQLVGFEIDAWDDELHTGWSVLVEGRAEEVYDDIEVAELETLGVRPWAPHPRRNRWVRIVAEEITGRRVG